MSSPVELSTLSYRGWVVVRLRNDLVEVDIVPGKGGDVIALRWRPLDVDVLWRTPWGLRHAGAVPSGADPTVSFIEAYPGGWQMIFPNGGDAVVERGVQQPFHGEASLAAWEWRRADGGKTVGVELWTHLARSPFQLRRHIELDGPALRVRDRVENTGSTPYQAMWSHHPAFGSPFLSGDCVVEAAARTIVVDPVKDVPAGDLEVGGRGTWPLAPARGGGSVDLSRLPADGPPCDRMAYLTDFERGHAAITNPALGLRVALDWDQAMFPHAWYWLEARATTDFPWYGQAYVFAIEPATSHPGHGMAMAREAGSGLHTFEPGRPRETEITCTMSPTDGGGDSGAESAQ